MDGYETGPIMEALELAMRDGYSAVIVHKDKPPEVVSYSDMAKATEILDDVCWEYLNG